MRMVNLFKGGLRNIYLCIGILFFTLFICSGCNEYDEEDHVVRVEFDAGFNKPISRGLSISEKERNPIESLYWSYTAVKQEGVYKTGEVKTETQVGSGAGLSAYKFDLSSGKWKIKLVAYTTSSDRSAKTSSKVFYSGEKVVTISGSEFSVSINVSAGPAFVSTEGTLEFETYPTIKVPTGMSFANNSKVVITVKKDSSVVATSTTTISGAKAAGTAVTLTNFSVPTNISNGVNTLTVTITYTPSGESATNLANGTTGVCVPVLIRSGCTTVIGKDWNGCVTYRP